jgi:hypothetical protein
MVAREVKNVLEKELGGWFRETMFAIDGGPEPYGTRYQRAWGKLEQLARSTG